MEIDVSQLLKAPGQAIAFAFEEQWVPLEFGQEKLEFVKPVSVSGTAAKVGRLIQVKGEIRTEIRRQCGRCLEPYTFPLEVPLEVEYLPLHEVAEGPAGQEDRDKFTIFTGKAVFLDTEIKAAMVLDLPISGLCQESCKGLCPKCGQNLNEGECQCPRGEIDPRLAVLQKLLKEV
ncbi:uncharacterized protein SAMN02745885_00829 [Carboxydocella sporoproducens DSM 16521]|uniref:DUF177 domain-containing protein n=2 Tax=Carboxydocella TaxID=178898 RepID=A0A1T4N7T8_9FIRM|nr:MULTISPECIES: DUF177 domain-containing protein [Carboxydocella]AVX20938.1 uncharacterized protein CFE_1767 [Carboxydocella thermautotrophica]GAW29899.1 hypothetical protein ULO1_24690 [Carboxydocella sp. ULO1]SJZ75243.1 uncharacterized protein SAMN02745885_00829 [Carboxydocella sporoproducens DSM 16521]